MTYMKKNVNILIVTALLVMLLPLVPVGDSVNSDMKIVQDISMKSIDPKIVQPNEFNDKNNDKIQDDLNEALDAMENIVMPQFGPQSANLNEILNIRICLTKEPDHQLVERFRNYGAKITSFSKELIYIIEAEVSSELIPLIALDPYVSLIEKQAISFAHLDTSTVNFGVRGSPYVWDANSQIKGNSYYSIAVLDTGIDSSHSDMENMIYFQDFSSHGYPSGTTGVDYGHHGTHCASIAAGTGNADTNPDSVNQVISSTLSDTAGYFNSLLWFEVKDNPSGPNTIATMNWDTSSGGSVRFIVGDGSSWITPTVTRSYSPIVLNLGNLAAGWYQLACVPSVDQATSKDFTVTISSEYSYKEPTEPANSPVFQGVAPNSNLVSLKILDDSGSGTDTWLLNALNWVSANGKNPLYNVTVVSMSIGFSSIISSIDTAVNNLVDEGFVVVTSAGNGGTNGGLNVVHSPATAAKCIAVGAVNDAYEITYYSANGDGTLTYQKPDVVAPGGTIAGEGSNALHNLILAADSNYGEDNTLISDVVSNDYRGMQGTSMSCPHISGLAQLAIDAIVQTEGTWTWTQANALRVKQLLCMGTWEVRAGETANYDGDGISQDPLLNRIGSDYVEGFGMTRGDAVIQSITNSTIGGFTNRAFYLDRRDGVYAKDQKVLLFSFAAQVGVDYTFNLDVPSTGDFDLIVYDKNYESATGRPIVASSSINAGLGTNENLIFSPSSSGTYYWSVRAVDGYGTCQVSLTPSADLVPPEWDNLSESADPLEFGEEETITITATDDVGVHTVKINIDSIDYFMESIGGDLYQYSWTPSTTDQISYYIVVNDTSNNEVTTPTYTLDVIDTNNPVWIESPIDQTIEYGTRLTYDVNATDPSGIDYYWVNDSSSFTINENGIISDNNILPIGEYFIEIRAYDEPGNYCTATITITVEDTTSPTWDFLPMDQNIEYGSDLSYDIGANDLAGIDYYWINDTVNFQIDGTGLITNIIPLEIGTNGLEIRAYDDSGNYCSATIMIIIEDTTAPTWDFLPVDQTVEFGSGFFYDVDASDPSGINSYWVNDTVNFQIDGTGGITNIIPLNIGIYGLEIRAYDGSGELCSATITVTVEDTTAPTWDILPTDQNIEYGSDLSYDIGASDLAGIDSYWINDTVNFQIDGTGLITNIIPLEIGTNGLEIRAYDGSGNFCSVTIMIIIEDTTAPTWDFLPVDQTVEFGSGFFYDVDASDSSGINSYWVNDTVNFQIDESGMITNKIQLEIGTYSLEIRAYDGSGEYCSATITVTVEDTTAPTWDILPTDQNIEYGSDLSYDIGASDLAGIDSYWINDTVNFQIDGTGLITNIIPLEIGTNGLEIRAYDGSGNFCSVTIMIIIEDTTDPTWDILPVDQTVEFGSEFFYDVDASDSSGINSYWVNDTVNFQIDGTGGITNITQLEIGTYSLEIRAYDGSGEYCSAIITITVEPNTVPTWDFVPIDQTIEYGSDFSYDLDASDSSGINSYWVNDTANFQIDGTGQITNITQLEIGIYILEIRAYDGSGDYCSATITITVEDTTDPTWDILPTDQTIEYGSDLSYDIEASDLAGLNYYWVDDNDNFQIDGSGLITNKIPLEIGIYSLEIHAYDGSGNYCSVTITIIVVDTTDPTWDILPTDQTIEYGSDLSYDIEASDLSGIDYYWVDDTVNFQIDESGVITNKTQLEIGTYNLEIRAYDSSGNYCSVTITITVTDAPPEEDNKILGYPLLVPIFIGVILIYMRSMRKSLRKRE